MSSVKTITDQEFEAEVIQAGHPVLVYFWAPWCGPCRLMPSVLESLGMDYSDRLKIVKMEVDPNPVAVANYKVQGVPAFRLFQQGQLLSALEGAMTRPKLEEMLKQHFNFVEG